MNISSPPGQPQLRGTRQPSPISLLVPSPRYTVTVKLPGQTVRADPSHAPREPLTPFLQDSPSSPGPSPAPPLTAARLLLSSLPPFCASRPKRRGEERADVLRAGAALGGGPLVSQPPLLLSSMAEPPRRMRELFLAGLAAAYLAAFVSLYVQIPGTEGRGWPVLGFLVGVWGLSLPTVLSRGSRRAPGSHYAEVPQRSAAAAAAAPVSCVAHPGLAAFWAHLRAAPCPVREEMGFPRGNNGSVSDGHHRRP